MLTEPHSNGRDRTWIAALALSFLYGLAVSWQRWGNPLIDTGREMNVPLRILGGEALYSDIRHIYGPLSPWLHAALYGLFGPTLNVLYADGIACAALAAALIYWLSRQIMGPAASGAAALSFIWLCVFKQSGNYVLPYAYNALHGTVLGLATLAVLARTLRSALTDERPLTPGFLLAGILAGLTLLAKTEMGMAAVAAGAVAAPLAGSARRAGRFRLTLSFLATAGALAMGTYTAIAAQTGWSTLVNDSWLLGYNLPPEIAHYNRRLAGLNRPFYSAWRVLLACLKLGVLAAMIASLSALAAGTARRSNAGHPLPARSRAADFVVARPWHALAAALGLSIVLSVTTGLDWDKGPFLAMPVLLAAFIIALARQVRHGGVRHAGIHASLLLVYSVYALASLGRLALHVQSGGGYGSFLLPVSIVIFTYLWVGPFADALGDDRVASTARNVALALLVTSAVVSAVMLGVRYRTRNTIAIHSPRGTMIAEREAGIAWNEALAFVEARTTPGDPIAVLPEGTSLTFLSGRRNPLREEIATPGFLDRAGEARAIRQLEASNARLVLIANRPTAEFGPNAFGRDYAVELMRWIDARYRPCGTFGTAKNQALTIGERPFFVRAYCAAE